MTKSERNNIFMINYAVALTSIVYFIAKYFMIIEGDWGPQTHPLAIWFQKVHIISTPLLVFAVGSIFSNHIWKRIKSGYRPSRTSGIFLLVLFVLMSFTGYLIQILDSQLLREYSSYLHLGTSFIWMIGFSFHHMVANRKLKA